MEELFKKPWEYTFYKHNDQYIISVLCGSAAMFQMNITLNDMERDQYLIQGRSYLDELALKISKEPEKYKHRVSDILE